MFLHLGSEVVVSKNEVIAILDIETGLKTQVSNEFFRYISSEKKVTNVHGETEPKSLILTDHGAFLSSISTVTLQKRGKGRL